MTVKLVENKLLDYCWMLPLDLSEENAAGEKIIPNGVILVTIKDNKPQSTLD